MGVTTPLPRNESRLRVVGRDPVVRVTRAGFGWWVATRHGPTKSPKGGSLPTMAVGNERNDWN